LLVELQESSAYDSSSGTPVGREIAIERRFENTDEFHQIISSTFFHLDLLLTTTEYRHYEREIYTIVYQKDMILSRIRMLSISF